MLSYDSPVPIVGNPTVVDMPNKTTPPTGASGIASTTADGSMSPQNAGTKKPHHIWLVTGPAGVGKSTVAAYLSQALGFTYIEGDDVSLSYSELGISPESFVSCFFHLKPPGPCGQ